MCLLSLVPLFKDYIWGGRRLKEVYQRPIPDFIKTAESWELVDRELEQSFIPEANKTLHELWESDEKQNIFGTKAPDTERFPILIKLLDAQEKLSLQVHPPANLAKELGGEPKTEMWYFLKTEPEAQIYVGLKKGVTKEAFTKAIEEKKVAACFHVLKTAEDKVMFLPSGRVHAIGEGNLILEIQQNSNTTYRVYDWDRVDVLGNPRDLHIDHSLKSIRFDDIEPQFTQPHGNRLLCCDYFKVERFTLLKDEGMFLSPNPETFQYFFVAKGEFQAGEEKWGMGKVVFMTADHDQEIELTALSETSILIKITF
jgi:mannose-6-phosphate isomerase